MEIKRPQNAYILFCEDKREQVLRDDPSLNHKSVMQRLGALWKDLPEELKQPYKEKAHKLLEEFKQQIPEYHYKQKKGKQKQNTQPPKFMTENILPVDPNFLMALGIQTLMQSANQTHMLNIPQFQPIAPVSMPPPPGGGKSNSNARTAMLALQFNRRQKTEVPSMPPPPGFKKPSITISMPPPPTVPRSSDIPSMPPPKLIDSEEIPGPRGDQQIRFSNIPSMPPPVKMPPPPSNIPKMPPPPPLITMPPPPQSIVPKMPPPPGNWN